MILESVCQRLGPQAMVDALADLNIGDMMHCDPYKDGSQKVVTFPSLDKEPEITPNWGGQY